MTRPLPTALAALLAATLALAQAPEPPAAPGAEAPQLSAARGNAAKRLREIAARLDAGQAAQVGDELRKFLQDSPDELVPVPGSGGRYLAPAHRAAEAVLAKLPPAELRAYRDRVDAPALALLKRGQTSRDPRPLEELLSRDFGGRATADALQLLGELASERGDHAGAAAHFGRLLALPAALGGDRADRPAALARLALARHAALDPAGAGAALAELRKVGAEARGTLAGREGTYVELVEALRRVPAKPPAVRAPPGGDWPTFAGTPGRSGATASVLARHWPARPTWRAPLPGSPPGGAAAALVPRYTAARQVNRHPVIFDGFVYAADGSRVAGFDLRTGAPAGEYRYPGAANPPPLLGEAEPADADATLTVVPARRLLLARFTTGAGAGDAAPRSVIVGLAVGAGGALAPSFALRPPASAGPTATFDAAPTSEGGRLYAGFQREANNRLVRAVACYPEAGGEPLWSRDLTEGAVPGRADIRGGGARGEPVSAAQDRVVAVTHAGQIVALDAATGRPVWAHLYPPATRPSGRPRDLAPAVIDAGRVLAAPLDSDRILCLELATGQLLWEREQLEVDQLLGVVDHKLVAALAAPQRGLRAFDLTTGDSFEPAGWQIHDDPQLASYGRGLVSPGAVLWPTRAGVFFVRPSDGLPLGPRLRGPHGNLAFGGGVLVSAGAFELAGYVPDAPLAELPPARPELLRRRLELAPPGGGAAALGAFRAETGMTPGDERAAVAGAAGAPSRLGDAARAHFGAGVPSPARPAALPPVAAGPEAFAERPAAAGAGVALVGPAARPLPGLDGAGVAGVTGARPPDAAALVADGGSLAAYRPGASEPLWKVAIPDGLSFTGADAAAGLAVAAGPRGAAAFALADGRLAWEYVSPPSHSDWSAARPGPGKLLAWVGRGQLLALDANTGDILWCRDGAGRPRVAEYPLPLAPDYDPEVAWAGDSLIVRRSDGFREQLRAADGRLVRAEPSSVSTWPTPPAWLGPERLAVADGPGLVRAIRPGGPGGRAPASWEWAAPNPAGLLGSAPQLLRTPAGLVVVTERTYARELDLLTPDRGRWAQAALLPGAGQLAVAANDEAVFAAAGPQLHALRRRDGRPAWRAPSPRWSLAAGSRAVRVACLDPAPAESAPFAPGGLLGLRSPAEVVPWLLAQCDACRRCTVTVAAFDPATGAEQSRLTLDAGGPGVVAELGGPHPVVGGPGVLHWLGAGD